MADRAEIDRLSEICSSLSMDTPMETCHMRARSRPNPTSSVIPDCPAIMFSKDVEINDVSYPFRYAMAW